MSRPLVIGIGNIERGDDGVGRQVARLLKHMLGEKAEILEQDGEAGAILAHIEKAQTAYLVDACMSSAPPGTVHRIDAAEGELPLSSSDLSTHGFGLASAIELARSLGQLPAKTIVFAIEADSFEPGAPLSKDVSDAAVIVADRIRSELEGTG
ncbi:MAG TPA: hydrogenase maturation protease [Rhizomicrobium sp.]|nr:hydrogenase maturation protease [Rhizomicrobium sp.]